MLNLFRLHTAQCRKTNKVEKWDREFRRCRCPIHAEGTLRIDGLIRKATGEYIWDHADAVRLKWEEWGSLTPPPEEHGAPMTLKQAADDFLRDLQGRNWQPSSIAKFRCLLVKRGISCSQKEHTRPAPSLISYAERKGITHLRDVNLRHVSEFRSEWLDSPSTAAKRLEQLRTFFRHWVERGVITVNPALSRTLRVKFVTQEKEPFTPDEYGRILGACDLYPADRWDNINPVYVDELRAMVLTLRHSGLRIGDAVRLQKSALVRTPSDTGWALHVWMQKAQRPVYIPVPDEVEAALRKLPWRSDTHFFWNGCGDGEHTKKNWVRRLDRLYRIAATQVGSRLPFSHKPHAHRFRHTFAAEHLLAGMDIRHVSILLGHKSIRVTEKHYAKFNLRAQEKLDEATRESIAKQMGRVSGFQIIKGKKQA